MGPGLAHCRTQAAGLRADQQVHLPSAQVTQMSRTVTMALPYAVIGSVPYCLR